MVIKFGGITIVKDEKDLLKFLSRFWGGFIFIIATAYFSSGTKLYQVERYFGIVNTIYFFIISVYGFIAAFISLKKDKPTNCTLTLFCAGLALLFLGITNILWYSVDQVTVTWLDLVSAILKFCIGSYVGLTIFILNNLKIINLKRNKELTEKRELKKREYEEERRIRENDRRIRDEDRRKILDGLANVAVDRRVGLGDRRVNPDRRKPNPTEQDFKNDVAKRTAEMVGFLTHTLDKLDNDINELDEELKITDDKLSCLEEMPICIDISINDDDTAVVVNDDEDITSGDVDSSDSPDSPDLDKKDK